ncbi:hypothetical protein EQM14_09415 [Caproiciproducens sp. NJN-50]|uniref:YkvI family membrane protein n=1 Tax=Acutalibacteraceae TaxID=3082771 RepID=UPI000FFE159F|nr:MULTISPECIES: hypothetical protein [Acutalibacteraceae]QAT49970.1 hypothetical protein EQM14_09415 [Caproiciproducens sp. NJN-50]
MNSKKQIVPIGLLFSVAATWFGIHAGGGFASGAQTMSFIVRWGRYGTWTFAVTFVFIALVYRELVLLGRNYQVYNFRQMVDVLYHPYNKVMSPLYEICYNMANILAIASCVAGGATVLQNLFGLNYTAGIILIGALILVLCIFGAGLVRKASTVFSILIILSVLIISFTAFGSSGFHLGAYLASDASNTTTLGNALYRAFCYTGFQMWCFAGVLGVSQGLITKKSINASMAIGFIINILGLGLTCYVMLGFMPQAQSATLPLYYVCETLNQRIVLIAYTTCLFCAYISTGVGVIYGMVLRYTELFTRNKPQANKTAVNAALGAVYIIACVLCSTFGLTPIINIGFNYMGVVGLFVVTLPALIAGHIKNKRFEEAHPDYEKELVAKSEQEEKKEPA